MPTLWKNILGVFVIDSGEIVEKREFSRDSEEVVKNLLDKCDEEKELEDKYSSLRFEKPSLSLLEISKEIGAFEREKDLRDFVREVGIELTERKIEASKGEDQEVIEAVRSYNELKDIENKLVERLRSWSELYDIGEDNLLEGIESLDREEGKSNLKELKNMFESLKVTENSLESYIERKTREIAPNVSEVLEPLLAARILALAGSLEKLAKMPSSTVQVLGAEKALFRYMKGKGSAPKHGVIFLHPKVNQAPKGKKGKMARFISNKISIAARLDFYGDKFKGDELRKEVEEKFEEVGE